jgi:ribosomal RNA-processing protein 9
VQASGAGDGVIRLWSVADRAGGGTKTLQPLGGVPARGFVTSLHLARSARFVVAGMGQEHRMGRWVKDRGAPNGVLVHPLSLADE